MSPKPMPLHHQLREQLLNRILRGEWAPGAPMATEHELAAEYRVSRQTIREAIRALRYEGIVQARRGSGTFVRAPIPGGPLTLLQGPPAALVGAADGWTTRVVRCDMRQVGEAEAGLEVAPGTPVWLIEKLRLRDGLPFGLTYSFCLAHEGADQATGDGSGRRGLLSVSATVLHPYEARLLDEGAHTAALQLEVLCRDADGRVTELHRSIIPASNLRVEQDLGAHEVALLNEMLDLAADER